MRGGNIWPSGRATLLEVVGAIQRSACHRVWSSGGSRRCDVAKAGDGGKLATKSIGEIADNKTKLGVADDDRDEVPGGQVGELANEDGRTSTHGP